MLVGGRWVLVGTGVLEGMGVAVGPPGVCVGGVVGVLVGVEVGVEVGVLVGVLVGVEVRVGVGVKQAGHGACPADLPLSLHVVF